MGTKFKSEIKWILLIGGCALALTLLILSEFQNYNWTLGPEHSQILWILWIFFSLVGTIGGIFYFTRLFWQKEYCGVKNWLSLIFLTISIIGTYRIAQVTNGLDKFLLTTSEKTENGFTIYPPMTMDLEQLEQLNGLKSQATIPNGLMLFLMILLLITVLITWKRKKSVPNTGSNS